MFLNSSGTAVILYFHFPEVWQIGFLFVCLFGFFPSYSLEILLAPNDSPSSEVSSDDAHLPDDLIEKHFKILI